MPHVAYKIVRSNNSPIDPWRVLRDLPEHGPGFQFVDVSGGSDGGNSEEDVPIGRYLVFNCELFIPIENDSISDTLSAYNCRNSYN